MKITASSRRDEILKRKAEYEADYQARKSRHDEQLEKFYQAKRDVFAPIKQEIQSHLDKFTALNFSIDVRDQVFGDCIEVRVQCNQDNIFKETSALSWEYSVIFSTEEIKRDSGSWSGLKATTPEQMESLRQTVAALEYLNSVDWANLLAVKVPDYRDYVTEEDPSHDRNKPNFTRELLEEDIKDAMGTTTMFRGECSNERSHGKSWYQFISETAAFYTVHEVSDFYIDRPEIQDRIRKGNYYTTRIKKDKMFQLLDKPAQTRTI